MAYNYENRQRILHAKTLSLVTLDQIAEIKNLYENTSIPPLEIADHYGFATGQAIVTMASKRGWKMRGTSRQRYKFRLRARMIRTVPAEVILVAIAEFPRTLSEHCDLLNRHMDEILGLSGGYWDGRRWTGASGPEPAELDL